MSEPTNDAEATNVAEAEWRRILEVGHRPVLAARRVFRYLPSAPRCKMCQNPFGGVGGFMVGLAGFRRSQKNPNLCTQCCDRLPPGGAEVDVGVLFADIRGSTTIAEGMSPSEYAALLNRFYQSATSTLVARDAVIDKLIGDEVMAFFVRGMAGDQYREKAVHAAANLLRDVGYGSARGPWIQVGIGVHVGPAYVGNVGSTETVDFTALGDTINTAARLRSEAGPGEIIVSEDAYRSVAASFPEAELRSLALRGKSEDVAIRVLRP